MIKLNDGREVYSTKEASCFTNLSYPTIMNWIKSNRLEAQKIGGSWYMTREAIDDAVEGKTLKR